MRFAGVDVGAQRHFVAMIDEQGDVVQQPRPFGEDAEGYERVLRILGTPGDVLVVMEATGHYWRNLFGHLVAKGHRVAVINAAISNRFARLELRRAKTDQVDALGLARLAQTLRPQPTPVAEEEIELLKDLVRWRERYVQDASDRVRQLHQLLDLAFPEVTSLLRDMRSRRPIAILRHYPSAKMMAKADVKELADLVYDGRHRVGEELAGALVELAGRSVGRHATTAELIVPQLCDDIERLRKRIGELDRSIEEAVERQELGRLLTTIPGISTQCAARLLGEVGDPAKFASGAALASYVGVVPATSSSGARQPSSASICPIGNARLRRALWMPVVAAIRCNPWLRAFYERLIAAGKKPKVALVAVMNKLLRAVYSVARHRRPFTLPPEAATG
jgi:transposase